MSRSDPVVLVLVGLLGVGGAAGRLPEWHLQTNSELERLLEDIASSDVSVRQRAAIALGNLGDARAVDPLVKALGDEDRFVRDFAAKALGNIGDSKAVEPLIQALGDENILVRRTAATALGDIGDSRSLEPLIRNLEDENVLVRRSAAAALGNLGDPAAAAPLVKALADENNVVRDFAALALTQIGEPVIPELLSALGSWTLGPGIAAILGNLNWSASQDQDRIRLAVAQRHTGALLENWGLTKKVLLADLESGESDRARNAAYAFIGIGREEVIPDLVRALNTEGTREMAQVFLRSGNEDLADAAKTWALKNGQDIADSVESAAVRWGEMRAP